MTDHPKHLNKPPIAEALVGIQIQPIAGLTVENIREKLPSMVLEQFPTVQDDDFIDKNLEVRGLMLKDAKNTKAIRMRMDGFVLSHLPPYKDFENLRAEAQRLWINFKELAGQKVEILKVVLRYINVIECHRSLASWSELGEFLKNFPLPPEKIAPIPESFGMEMTSRNSAENLATTVRRSLLKSVDSSQHGIGIDIEVVKQFDRSPNEDELWSSIETLRPIKNDIFFDLVSDKKIKDYEPAD